MFTLMDIRILNTCHPVVSLVFFTAAIILSLAVTNPLFCTVNVLCASLLNVVLRKRRAIPLLAFLAVAFAAIALINPLFNTDGENVLFTCLGRPYTVEALCHGASTATMFVSMILWFSALTCVMTDDRAMFMIARIAPSLSMVVTMIFRLFPSFSRKAEEIAHARACIGKSSSAPTLKEKIGNSMQTLSILIACSMDDSVQTVQSMRSRGYGTGKRSSFAKYPFTSRDIVLLASIGVAVSAVVAGGAIGTSSYAVVSLIVIGCAMLPFFVSFERSRPKAREVVMMAVLCAIAVASRAVFAYTPSFKPTAAIVMICGIAFGPRSGFMAGAVTMLASNMIFGQGPWTPWQMLSFGACGLVFGALADKGFIPKDHVPWKKLQTVSVLAASFIVFIAGPVLDTSTLFFMVSTITPQATAAVYLAGVPWNCMLAAATFITLMLAANPLLGIISRVEKKYGNDA